MSTDGSLAPLASSCGWFHAGAPAWRTVAKAEPPATNTTARRPPSDAAPTRCAAAAARAPAGAPGAPGSRGAARRRGGGVDAAVDALGRLPRAADQPGDEDVVDAAVAAHV